MNIKIILCGFMSTITTFCYPMHRTPMPTSNPFTCLADPHLAMKINPADWKKVAVDVDAQDDDDKTPMHKAVETNRLDLLSNLLSYGANPNLQDNIGNTALHTALLTNNVQAAYRIIMEHQIPLDLSLTNHQGATVIDYAYACKRRLIKKACLFKKGTYRGVHYRRSSFSEDEPATLLRNIQVAFRSTWIFTHGRDTWCLLPNKKQYSRWDGYVEVAPITLMHILNILTILQKSASPQKTIWVARALAEIVDFERALHEMLLPPKDKLPCWMACALNNASHERTIETE